MTKNQKYLLFALAGILLSVLFTVVLYLCRTNIPVCPETDGMLNEFRYYFDENKNEWVSEQNSAVIGEDITAVRINDFSELNVIEKVNYVPDEFIVPSSNPVSYDYQTVSLKDPAFAESGSIVIFLMNLDPTDPDFTEQSKKLDRYKIGDYWKFSIMLPKIFTAANVYVDSSLAATIGEISDYEFIKYNTSDDRVSVKHLSETERTVLELEFYTRREAVNNHAVTIHYQSGSETLAGLTDFVIVGSSDAVESLKVQYPVTFIVALVVSVMILFVLIVLSFLKKTKEFIAETLLMSGVMALALANYALANVTSLPLFLSSLRYSANFVILGGAALMLSKDLPLPVRISAALPNGAGFISAFVFPYVNSSAAHGLSLTVTVLKLLSALCVVALIFLPLFRKSALPSLLRTLSGGITAVNVVASIFILPTSEVLTYPPIWLYFALTLLSLATVVEIIAATERENAYVTANLNSEVERQVKDIRSVISERDKLLQFLSHDLKKPLLSGENYLNTLIEREQNSEQTKLLNIVKQNNKKVLDNMTEIASYAKLNYVEETSRPVDLFELCRKLYEYCSEDCKASGIMLKNTVDKKISVFAKPKGLENALTNIILNAIEHAECTEITLSLRTDKNKALLTISDNGKGISPDIDVFRPYISENKPETGGLGLYICKNIIESMNGELTFECNEGTAFTVALLKA